MMTLRCRIQGILRRRVLNHEIFVRRYKFDEKLRDIAKAMGLNVSTVKTRLSRGKRKLRKILSDAEEKQ